MEIITRQQAKENKSTHYFTGEPCANGHIDKRYTNTGICYGCKRQRLARTRIENPETQVRISRRSYAKNPAKFVAKAATWAINNRKKSNSIKKNWKQRNPEHQREYDKRKRQDPTFRLSKAVSLGIWKTLRGQKPKRWAELVDFTIDELKAHLEAQFTSEMTWDNYGSYWQIDHKKPKSWFTIDQFKDAWALSNLQPLPGVINASKCNRYEN